MCSKTSWLTAIVSAGGSPATPDAATTASGTGEEGWISDFCPECMSVLSDVIKKREGDLLDSCDEEVIRITDTRAAAKSFLESCRLRFRENVAIEVLNRLGLKECMVGGIPLSVAQLFEKYHGSIMEKIIRSPRVD